jgi:hypothetical protein
MLQDVVQLLERLTAVLHSCCALPTSVPASQLSVLRVMHKLLSDRSVRTKDKVGEFKVREGPVIYGKLM